MLQGKKIVIVGLGLIGGSIEKRLEEKQAELGISEIKTVSKSQKRAYSIRDLGDCDLVFLCAPQSKVLEDLDEIAKIIAQSNTDGEKLFANTLITDVASTKGKIFEKAKSVGLTNFVAGHPMAGTEHEGYQASFPELFEDSNWILSEKNAQTEFLEFVITQVLGAKQISVVDPLTHDKFVAVTSHLPMLLSFALLDLIKNQPSLLDLTGPGFKSMTRLASGNTEMSKEIIAMNRDNIRSLWQEYSQNVDMLVDLPASLLTGELQRIKKLGSKLNCS